MNYAYFFFFFFFLEGGLKEMGWRDGWEGWNGDK